MPTRRHLLTTALAAALTTSCTRPAEPEPTTLPTPSGGGTTAPDEAAAAEDEDPTFTDSPTDAAASDSAGAHATATLDALWATTKPQDQWYADLAALMTPAGGDPFQYSDVEAVVPGTITGDPAVTFEDAGNTAIVTVPSDQGDWTLVLYRDGDAWLTESIDFPEEA